MLDKVRVSPIKEMEMRGSNLSDVISLAQGIPSFDTPDCIKKKAIEAIENGKVARYSLTPGILELREAIEYSLAKENISYDYQNEIIVTSGSIEAITATLLTLLDEGDEVLIPDPTYTSYQEAIKTARGIPVGVPLNESGGWSFEVSEIEKRVTKKTKAILFCNPNNPTGTVYNRDQLMEIMEISEKHNLYVLSDEVYKDFIYDGDDFYSLGQFPAFRQRLIYIFSFSKAYAMTGWRVAFLATDKVLAKKILAVHDALVTCTPVVSQWAALAALEMAGEEVKFYKKEFEKRRDLMCGKLDDLLDWISYVRPSSAYFAFPRLRDNFIEKFKKWQEKHSKLTAKDLEDYQKKSISWQFSLELLYSNQVAVVPGEAFGEIGENHFRLCFGRQEENIGKGLNRIKDFFEKIERETD